MENEHIISDDAVDGILAELSRIRNWLAYNTIPYLLEKADIFCFKYRNEADEFALSNISEYDSFNVVMQPPLQMSFSSYMPAGPQKKNCQFYHF